MWSETTPCSSHAHPWPRVAPHLLTKGCLRGLSGLKLFDVTRTLNTTYFGRNKPKRLSRMTPFLFFMLYFNNSTGKRNSKYHTYDIPLHHTLIIHIHLSCCLQCNTLFTLHSILCPCSFLAHPSFSGAMASLSVTVEQAESFISVQAFGLKWNQHHCTHPSFPFQDFL